MGQKLEALQAIREDKLTDADLLPVIDAENILLEDPEALRYAASHATEESTLEQIAERAMRTRMAYHDAPEEARGTVDQRANEILRTVAYNEHTSNKVLSFCISSNDPQTIYQVTQNPNSDKETQQRALDTLKEMDTDVSKHFVKEFDRVQKETEARMSRFERDENGNLKLKHCIDETLETMNPTKGDNDSRNRERKNDKTER